MDAMEQKIIAWIDEHRDEIIEDFKTLVKTESQTGNEYNAQQIVKKHLEKTGALVDMWDPDIKEIFEKYPDVAQFPTRFEPEYDLVLKVADKCTYEQLINSEYKDILNYKNRPNVVGTIKGTGGGRSLMFNDHIDTVTIGDRSLWTRDPLGAQEEGDRVYGRGAADTKAGVTAMLYVLRVMNELNIKLRGDLMASSVVNEEHAGNGTLGVLARGYKADAVIVADNYSYDRMIYATGGNVTWEIKILGRQRHTGNRWENGEMMGISAVEKTPAIINALLNLEKEANLDGIKMNMGIDVINGGDYHTATAAECTIKGVIYFDAKLGAGVEGINEIKQKLIDTVKEACVGDEWLTQNPPQVYMTHYDDAYEFHADRAIIDEIMQAGRDTLGIEIQQMRCSASDVRHWGNTGNMPAVVYGAGNGPCAHAIDEWNSKDDIINATKVMAITAYRWCK